MGLLADIQNDAVSENASVASLLRKCLVLASNLDSELLEDWVRWELNGYPQDVEVPDYRKIRMNFKVSAHNLAYQVTNQPIAQALINDLMDDPEFDVFECRQAIGTIDIDQVKDAKGVLTINLDNYSLFLPGKIIDSSYVIQRFWGEVPGSRVLGVVDAVRNRVLEFVLALKKQYPNAGEVDGMTTKEPEVAQAVNHIYHTTIHGNAGVVGNANNSTVNITVNAGNMQDLRNQLLQQGIDQKDIIDLEAAIKAEPKIDGDKKFGPKVTKWVGNMLGKAASGAWATGLGAAGAVLEKALLGYYGYQ